MKRKIFTVLAVLVFFVSAAIPVSAASCVPVSCSTGFCFPIRCPWQLCGQLPCTPEQPGEPDTPDTPSVPDEPEAPSEPDTPETPDEPETPEQPDASAGASAYEQEVVRLVNQERARYGLSALTIRADLCGYARVKSQDMHDSGYFSHTSPNYGTPFEMMKAFGVTYAHAGENIAMGYSTPEAVVSAWMNSESHRANILSASYTEIGVGYVADGGYWTQWFVG